MKWVVIVEAILTALCWIAGFYSQRVASSADEAIISAPLYLLGGVGIIITFATLFFWWGWIVTFRG